MKPRFVSLLAACLAIASTVPAYSQGTRLWSQSTFEQLEQGRPQGVAITSDGRLVSGPSTALAATTPSTY
ncbi:MAG: hypothetical protein WBD10_00635, partial [Acidobacteriaceae bacterium]